MPLEAARSKAELALRRASLDSSSFLSSIFRLRSLKHTFKDFLTLRFLARFFLSVFSLFLADLVVGILSHSSLIMVRSAHGSVAKQLLLYHIKRWLSNISYPSSLMPAPHLMRGWGWKRKLTLPPPIKGEENNGQFKSRPQAA